MLSAVEGVGHTKDIHGNISVQTRLMHIRLLLYKLHCISHHVPLDIKIPLCNELQP